MNWDFILTGFLSILLLLTVFYCAVLDRRLRSLRAAQEELRALNDSFAKAADQAEHGIAELRKASKEIAGDLKRETGDAAALRDELRVMTQAGSALADRIEKGLVNRGSDSTAGARDGQDEPADASESERELMKALRQVS